MELTGKQERNGATGDAGTQGPTPGPDYTSVIAAAFAAASSASAYQMATVTPGATVIDWHAGVAGAANDGTPS